MSGFPWGSLITAGGSLLGGLFSDSSDAANAQKINQQNLQASREFAQNRIQWTAEDAKKAGIHPLAALGAQTFSPPTFQVPGQSRTGDAIGKGAEALGEAFTKLQLEGLKASNEKTKAEAALAAAQSRTVLAKARASESLKVAEPKFDALKWADKYLKVNPGFSDAEDFENRYGDIASEVFGLANLGADTYRNLKGTGWVQRANDWWVRNEPVEALIDKIEPYVGVR